MKSRVAAAWLACALLSADASHAQFQAALPGYRYQFPHDYFDHPEYQTEWWYHTGNLQTAEGRKFGFELTFFRQGVSRDPGKSSTWAVRDVYVAHFAISDLDGQQFVHAERTNRAGPGIAGASESLQKVWNGNWTAVWTGDQEQLAAMTGSLALSLSLQPRKPPVIHGENGVSQKSQGVGHASHYLSQTRLAASGTITVDSRQFAVSGLAWMDHEFFTQQLDPNQSGWDWVSLQLDDGTELMLFRIRRKDGSLDPFCAGTSVDARGRSRHLTAQDFHLEPIEEMWTSPATGARYPVHWKISIPSLAVVIDATTPLPTQEMVSTSGVVPNYWEGAILARGKKGSAEVTGSGYLEMTGYDRPVQLAGF